MFVAVTVTVFICQLISSKIGSTGSKPDNAWSVIDNPVPVIIIFSLVAFLMKVNWNSGEPARVSLYYALFPPSLICFNVSINKSLSIHDALNEPVISKILLYELTA